MLRGTEQYKAKIVGHGRDRGKSIRFHAQEIHHRTNLHTQNVEEIQNSDRFIRSIYRSREGDLDSLRTLGIMEGYNRN